MSAPERPIGVLVMAYGTPATPGDLEAYYTHIRRGRPPSPQQLDDLRRRYDALGGTSTLAQRTASQIEAIAASLDEHHPGRFIVAAGNKHAAPFIEDGVRALAGYDVGLVVGAVLAPHYSKASVGEYQARVASTALELDLPAAAIDRWHDLPAYRHFLERAVELTEHDLPQRTEVLFTAHSLPERVLADDPYPDELLESAAATADAAGIRHRRPPEGPDEGNGLRWSQAWQSAGATPEPWRGPDVLDVLRDRAASGEVDGILVCPQGFVADHLEVAYDLDIEAKALADQLGLAFARTRVLNDDRTVLDALAHRIAEVADAHAASIR